jgi:nucleoside-diphosphate-sugar epimerase
MRALVTGAAGFIGSHLGERLLAHGCDVRGVDNFSPYYDRVQKEANLAVLAGDQPPSSVNGSLLTTAERTPSGSRAASGSASFEFVERDLRTDPLDELTEGVDVVFHLAGQPGVRLSWADGFDQYDSNNILATQRLLEAFRDRSIDRFVLASSSSLYGDAERYPTLETDLPRPRSPYGVTKLAAEYLCRTYADNWSVPSVILRYFTVYGPRQRPDMAFNRLIAAGLGGPPFPLYGDGDQVREFTFVGDIVEATIAAGEAPIDEVPAGEVFNASGGSSVRLRDAIELAGDLLEREIALDRQPVAPGDALRTGGSIEKAQRLLRWKPSVDLAEGMAAQIAWQRAAATG